MVWDVIYTNQGGPYGSQVLPGVQFACQWLHVHEFDQFDEKNERLFPEFAKLRGSMYEETITFDILMHIVPCTIVVDSFDSRLYCIRMFECSGRHRKEFLYGLHSVVWHVLCKILN